MFLYMFVYVFMYIYIIYIKAIKTIESAVLGFRTLHSFGPNLNTAPKIRAKSYKIWTSVAKNFLLVLYVFIIINFQSRECFNLIIIF